jgi:hypothetical protein
MGKDPIQEDLEQGETVTWSRRANRFQGSRAVGGRLALTDRRLMFAPHRFDAALVGKRWEARLDEIRTIGIEPRGSGVKGLFGGGMRKRLRVRTARGDEEHFLVNKLDQVLESLEEAGVGRESAEEAGRSYPLGRPPGT